MQTSSTQIEQPPSETVRPPKTLMRQIGRAIGDYDMIRDGDRLMLGLSGGKVISIS